MDLSRVSQSDLIGRGRMANVYKWDDNRVIKLFHEGTSKQTVEYEYQMHQVVQTLDIAIPLSYEFLSDNGRHAIVFDSIEGRSMISQIRSKFWKLKHYARKLAQVHYELHQQRTDQLPANHLRLEEDIKRVEYISDGTKNRIIEFLHDLARGEAVCHGDYHPDNILITDNGGLPVIIDWITANTGHPLLDVARTKIMLQYSSPPQSWMDRIMFTSLRKPFYRTYLDTYLTLSEYTRDNLRHYELPVIAARLADNIADERDVLLSQLDILVQDLL